MEILLYGSRMSYSIFIRILLRSIAVILRLMSSCTGDFIYMLPHDDKVKYTAENS